MYLSLSLWDINSGLNVAVLCFRNNSNNWMAFQFNCCSCITHVTENRTTQRFQGWNSDLGLSWQGFISLLINTAWAALLAHHGKSIPHGWVLPPTNEIVAQRKGAVPWISNCRRMAAEVKESGCRVWDPNEPTKTVYHLPRKVYCSIFLLLPVRPRSPARHPQGLSKNRLFSFPCSFAFG